MKTIQRNQPSSSRASLLGNEAIIENQLSVSFVIPVYNDEHNIARCIQSIKMLAFPAHEVEMVILDNGSSDRTPAVMEKMEVPFHVVREVNVSGLRNYGASLAQGEFLAFVDSDVELAPQWLSRALEVFKNPGVVANGCFPGIPDDSTWVQRTWDIHQRGRYQYERPTPIPWLPSMNVVVRREAFCEIGGFNEALETAEDVDLCYRLGKRGLILCNPAMEAVHWGEARDLATFWKKEVWRGLGNMRGVYSHGWRWDELPSLLYPLYMIVCSVAVALAVILSGHLKLGWGIPLSLCALGLPALALSMKTAKQANQFASIPSLFVLYLTYGLARGFSIIKSVLFGKK